MVNEYVFEGKFKCYMRIHALAICIYNTSNDAICFNGDSLIPCHFLWGISYTLFNYDHKMIAFTFQFLIKSH